jgi:hypothetical protein
MKNSQQKPASEAFVQRISDNLDERMSQIENRFDDHERNESQRHNKIMEVLDFIAGKLKKFDEEHTLLSHRQSIHSDKIEKLEEAVFKAS